MQSAREKSSASEEVGIKNRKIVFRNPITKDIITEIEIPKYVRMVKDMLSQTRRQVGDITALKNKIKMLYIDVLHRGYHPIKGFEKSARNVFRPELNEGNFNREDSFTVVSSTEAIGTIWRCLGRQLGRPIKNYQINSVQKQLSDELNTMREQCSLRSKIRFDEQNQEMVRHRQLSEQLKRLQQKMLGELDTLCLKYDQQQQKLKQLKNSVRNVLKQQILNLQKQIFTRSLLAIRQLQQNTQLVELIMEQSYPNIKMSRTVAIKLLGQKVVKQKQDKYQHYCSQYNLHQQNIHICHRCLTPVNHMVNAVYCNDECANLNVLPTILTDPYMYCRMVINQNSWDKQHRTFMHPYLIYYRAADKDSVPLCNRYFCNKCAGSENLVSTQGHCSYCEGVCDCFRCQGMDALTKMMAIFVDYAGPLEDITKQFLMRFQSKNLSVSSKQKMDRKSILQNKLELNQYYEKFIEKKIILKKKELAEQFKKVEYFSQRIETDARQKYQKYKMAKLKIDESEAQKKQKLLKQREKSKRIREAEDKLANIKRQGKEYQQQKSQIRGQEAEEHKQSLQLQRGSSSESQKSIFQDSS